MAAVGSTGASARRRANSINLCSLSGVEQSWRVPRRLPTFERTKGLRECRISAAQLGLTSLGWFARRDANPVDPRLQVRQVHSVVDVRGEPRIYGGGCAGPPPSRHHCGRAAWRSCRVDHGSASAEESPSARASCCTLGSVADRDPWSPHDVRSPCGGRRACIQPLCVARNLQVVCTLDVRSFSPSGAA